MKIVLAPLFLATSGTAFVLPQQPPKPRGLHADASFRKAFENGMNPSQPNDGKLGSADSDALGIFAETPAARLVGVSAANMTSTIEPSVDGSSATTKNGSNGGVIPGSSFAYGNTVQKDSEQFALGNTLDPSSSVREDEYVDHVAPSNGADFNGKDIEPKVAQQPPEIVDRYLSLKNEKRPARKTAKYTSFTNGSIKSTTKPNNNNKPIIAAAAPDVADKKPIIAAAAAPDVKAEDVTPVETKEKKGGTDMTPAKAVAASPKPTKELSESRPIIAGASSGPVADDEKDTVPTTDHLSSVKKPIIAEASASEPVVVEKPVISTDDDEQSKATSELKSEAPKADKTVAFKEPIKSSSVVADKKPSVDKKAADTSSSKAVSANLAQEFSEPAVVEDPKIDDLLAQAEVAVAKADAVSTKDLSPHHAAAKQDSKDDSSIDDIIAQAEAAVAQVDEVRNEENKVMGSLKSKIRGVADSASRLKDSDVFRIAREAAEQNREVIKAIKEENPDDALISFAMKDYVPEDTIKGSALAAATLMVFLGNGLFPSLVAAPVAAYMSLTRGVTGEAFRALGEFWAFCSASAASVLGSNLDAKPILENAGKVGKSLFSRIDLEDMLVNTTSKVMETFSKGEEMLANLQQSIAGDTASASSGTANGANVDALFFADVVTDDRESSKLTMEDFKDEREWLQKKTNSTFDLPPAPKSPTSMAAKAISKEIESKVQVAKALRRNETAKASELAVNATKVVLEASLTDSSKAVSKEIASKVRAANIVTDKPKRKAKKKNGKKRVNGKLKVANGKVKNGFSTANGKAKNGKFAGVELDKKPANGRSVATSSAPKPVASAKLEKKAAAAKSSTDDSKSSD